MVDAGLAGAAPTVATDAVWRTESGTGAKGGPHDTVEAVFFVAKVRGQDTRVGAVLRESIPQHLTERERRLRRSRGVRRETSGSKLKISSTRFEAASAHSIDALEAPIRKVQICQRSKSIFKLQDFLVLKFAGKCIPVDDGSSY